MLEHLGTPWKAVDNAPASQKTRDANNYRAEGWDAAIEKVMETDVTLPPDNPYQVDSELRQAVAALDLQTVSLRHIIDLAEEYGVRGSHVVEMMGKHRTA